MLSLAKPESQRELFEENIFEIRKGEHYGKYSVWEEGVLKAEFFDLEVAIKFMRCGLAIYGFKKSEIEYIADLSLKKYRQWEDTHV